jgi:hypothetical protein
MTEQADDLAGKKIDGGVIDRPDAAKSDRYVAQFDQRLCDRNIHLRPR